MNDIKGHNVYDTIIIGGEIETVTKVSYDVGEFEEERLSIKTLNGLEISGPLELVQKIVDHHD